MGMTPVPAAGFITQTPPPDVEVGTQWFEDLRNATSQGPGQAADGAILVIAGGLIAPTLASHVVDTEGAAAADDLTNLDTTDVPDGRIVLLRCADPARVVTIKHASGGAGQILLSDGADYVLAATRQIVALKLKSGVWEEISRALAGDLGSAAKKDTGTASGTIPLLGSKGLPAVSGEQLTDIPRLGNFAPSQQSTPNMTLKIGGGTLQLGATLVKVAAQNTAAITPPVTHPRNDIVHIDAATGTVGVAAGTEAASPADPAVPAGKLPIARLRLATTQASLTSADFDDIRQPMAAVVSFSANKNAADQTGIVSSTNTKITYTTEEWDIGGYYDAANSKFLPLVPGKYLFIGLVTFSAVNIVDQASCGMAFYKNGSQSRAGSSLSASGSGNGISLVGTAILDMNGTTDYVEIYAACGGTGNKTVAGNITLTYFQGYRIGN